MVSLELKERSDIFHFWFQNHGVRALLGKKEIDAVALKLLTKRRLESRLRQGDRLIQMYEVCGRGCVLLGGVIRPHRLETISERHFKKIVDKLNSNVKLIEKLKTMKCFRFMQKIKNVDINEYKK